MEQKTVDIEAIKEKFKENLKASGWDRILGTFIDYFDFEPLYENLIKAHANTGITPKFNQIFRAFYECPYSELKIVMLGQDPYPQPGVADGIAFSCSNTMKLQPSLTAIYKELDATVYPSGCTWDPDLKKWANQGILMLNTALTTVEGKVGEHYAIWRPFMKYLIDTLVNMNSGIIYVFMGAVAKEWAKFVPETNYKLFCSHPASAGYRGGIWDSDDLFNRINRILESSNNNKIIW